MNDQPMAEAVQKSNHAWLKFVLFGIVAIAGTYACLMIYRLGIEDEASKCIAKHDFQKAVDIYNKVPKGAELFSALSQRSDCYFYLGQYENAIVDLTAMTTSRPNYAPAYAQRGECHRRLHQNELAIADYAKAISLQPKVAWAYAGRGNCYVDQKKFDEAIADYERAIELKPDDGKNYFERAGAYQKMGKPDLASKDFEKAKALGLVFPI